jgi:hypothetical protein
VHVQAAPGRTAAAGAPRGRWRAGAGRRREPAADAIEDGAWRFGELAQDGLRWRDRAGLAALIQASSSAVARAARCSTAGSSKIT